MTAPILFHPSSENVAVAWLSAWFPVGVATRLPKPGTWTVYSGTVQGFATVTVAGGTTRYGRGRFPVISVGTWAAVPGSDNPQWGAADQLAQLIVDETKRVDFAPTYVRTSAKYATALVHSVHLTAEPRRIPDQDESMAHFETEIVLIWTEEQ